MHIDLLSVIVPIYKQEKTIVEDLQNIHKALSDTQYPFEIIGVVDGTILDKSYTNAKKLKLKGLKIYGYKNNKGKGQAIRYGMRKAKGNIVTFIDSGMDIKPTGISMLIEHMRWYNADIIVGSKLHSASIVKGYTLKRKILTYGYYAGVKFLFGLKIRDTQTGLKAYKREVLENVLDKLVIKEFCFDIEILVVAKHMGFNRIYDAPVEVIWIDNNTSLSNVIRRGIIIGFVVDTLAVWYRLNILRYYDDGRKRKKDYDEDLKMYVNTGNMTDKRQVLIDIINKSLNSIRWGLNTKKNGNKK